jgi:hypothetical protein
MTENNEEIDEEQIPSPVEESPRSKPTLPKMGLSKPSTAAANIAAKYALNNKK